MSAPLLARANQWLTTRPWGMWLTQFSVIFRREFAKVVLRRYWIYLLAFAPVVVITMHGLDSPNGRRCNIQEDTLILAGIIQFYYLRLAIFFGSMGIFSWLFKGEIAERSLHYYLLAPVRRELLVVAKFAAGAVAAIVIFSAGITLAFFAMYYHFGAAGKAYMMSSIGMGQAGSYLLVTVLAWLGYGSLFLALSLMFKNPAIPGIVVMGWETISTVLPSLLQKLSLSFYLKNLLPVEVPAEGIFALFTVVAEPVRPAFAVLGLLSLTAAILVGACLRIRKLQISYTSD